MSKESQKGRFLWFIVILAVIALVINSKFASLSLPTSGREAPQIQPPKPQPAASYTKDILMVTDTTNVPTPVGYHLNVNWGNAPIHVVQGNLQVISSSPSHTEYSNGDGMTFQRNAGYYGSAMLHCTYTELR